jgi:hypothetical protein
MEPQDLRIYIAAKFHSGWGDPDAVNPNVAATASEVYPYHLESYHYIRKQNLDDVIRKARCQIFLDSGAFSMFTLGAEVDLDAYAEYICERPDILEIASNVDVIGRNQEQGSYDNQKYLESLKLPVRVCPVHHARDHDSWLVKYLDEGYDYIFLGGMVPETTGYLVDWLDHIWDKYLALPDGSARVKVHGFGLTTFELMERYPWFSVDSTSWLMVGRFGNILLRRPDGRPKSFAISRRSSSVHDEDQSYWSLDPHTQLHYDGIIRAQGFDPELLGTMHGMRDKWNIRFFKEYAKGLRPVFKRSAVTFF